MARPFCTNDEFVRDFPELGARGMMEKYGGDERMYYRRKNSLTKKLGITIPSPIDAPEGYTIKGTSTLYDCETGKPKIEWVKTTADKDQQDAIFKEVSEAMASKLPRVKPTKAPKVSSSDLMACYIVSDHHLGMLSWAPETGQNYNIKIAENILMQATQYLIDNDTACEKSTIAVLGDFMHYDSFESVTPQNRNILDADGRYPKMVHAAVRTLRYLIEAALRKHGSVHVIIEIGNHDTSSSIFLMECLANVYENEPRITIDKHPGHYHYFSHGKCLVGTHHGDGAKPNDLPLIMASDQAELWGKTKYRYWWTGHLHTEKSKDFAGCRWEQFRVLGPQDAWAHNKGYRSERGMNAIILSKEYGEVRRHTVNPEMLNV